MWSRQIILGINIPTHWICYTSLDGLHVGRFIFLFFFPPVSFIGFHSYFFFYIYWITSSCFSWGVIFFLSARKELENQALTLYLRHACEMIVIIDRYILYMSEWCGRLKIINILILTSYIYRRCIWHYAMVLLLSCSMMMVS